MCNRNMNIDAKKSYFETHLDAYNERESELCIDLELKSHITAAKLWLELFQNEQS